MDAPRNAPELRPLGVGEILDVAIKLFLRHAGTLLIAVAVVVVPVELLLVPLFTSALPAPTGPLFRPAPDPADAATALAAAVVGGILSFIATTAATAACYKAVGDAYLGSKPDWRASLVFAGRRLGPVLWVTLLATVIPLVICALILTIPVGIWLLVSWAVAVPALLAEGVRGSGALGRSWLLVRGRWWRTFATLLLAFVITLVVQGIVTLLLTLLVFTDLGESSFAATLLNQVVTAIATVLTTPFFAAVVAVIYFDLRVRKEGFDLALLAQGIGARAPADGREPLGAREPPAEGEHQPDAGARDGRTDGREPDAQGGEEPRAPHEPEAQRDEEPRAPREPEAQWGEEPRAPREPPAPDPPSR